MEVIILQDAPFANWGKRQSNGRVPAINLKKGDPFTFPDWYAQECIKSGLVASPDAASKLLKEMTEEAEASVAAKELAEEKGLDLAEVALALGKDKLTIRDVREYWESQQVGEENE
jgi:hypothetical protein